MTTSSKDKLKLIKQVEYLKEFMPASQLASMLENCKGEESAYFIEKINEMSQLIQEMPVTYEQDGKGDQAIASLHYFIGGVDAWVTEKDMEAEQVQAFGLVNVGQGAELGYISIQELCKAGASLDLHFEPKTIAEIKVGPEESSPPSMSS